MKLSSHRYGKARVRVLKVRREGARHELTEVEVSVLLEGDFETSFTQGDNSRVVATDTMKNTVQVLAKDQLGEEIERFGLALGDHFLARYPQVRQATIGLMEHRWQRLAVDGQPHPHSFCEGSRARPSVRILAGRTGTTLESGMEELFLLKSTGSGFAGFPRDEFTTLAETQDRILATNLTAHWRWSAAPPHYGETNRRILDAMLQVFATRHSPSVQATLFEMGQAALALVPHIGRVHLLMPNKHCLPVNLAPFGMENPNELFVPTDEPHGQIEATVER